jgi:predicted phage tail protein
MIESAADRLGQSPIRVVDLAVDTVAEAVRANGTQTKEYNMSMRRDVGAAAETARARAQRHSAAALERKGWREGHT